MTKAEIQAVEAQTREELRFAAEQQRMTDAQNADLITKIQELGRNVDQQAMEGILSVKHLREKLAELDGDLQFAETVIMQRLNGLEAVPAAIDPIGISTRAKGPDDANEKLKIALEDADFRMQITKIRLSKESEILEQLINQKQTELDAMPDRIDATMSDLNRYDISIERFLSVDRRSCGCPFCKSTTIYYELDVYAPKNLEPEGTVYGSQSVNSVTLAVEKAMSGNQPDFRQVHKTWKQFCTFHEQLKKEMKKTYKRRGSLAFKNDVKEGFKPFPALPSKNLESLCETESNNLSIAEKRRAELNKYMRQLTAVRGISVSPVFQEFVQVA
jgi:hypothetical protein